MMKKVEASRHATCAPGLETNSKPILSVSRSLSGPMLQHPDSISRVPLTHLPVNNLASFGLDKEPSLTFRLEPELL
jgi:hypothetical protein